MNWFLDNFRSLCGLEGVATIYAETDLSVVDGIINEFIDVGVVCGGTNDDHRRTSRSFRW